jgi:hypothetical protein
MNLHQNVKLTIKLRVEMSKNPTLLRTIFEQYAQNSTAK